MIEVVIFLEGGKEILQRLGSASFFMNQTISMFYKTFVQIQDVLILFPSNMKVHCSDKQKQIYFTC